MRILTGILAVLLALLIGCDSSDDNLAPKAVLALSPPSNSLISASQLKRWIDNGYRDDWGYDVVVLDTGFDWSLDTRAVYEAGHVPGAYYVGPGTFYEMTNLRCDGVVGTAAMVPDGLTMDAFLQTCGIDGSTTVVLTGNHIWGPARAYWALRYWGFSRNQLYILDGKANGPYSIWTASGYDLQTEEPPAPEPSDFSVSEWEGNMDAVRASTEELFEIIGEERTDSVIIDARTEGEAYGYITPETNIFGFRIKDSVWKEWCAVLAGGEDGTHHFKPAAALAAEFEALGLSEDETGISFCQSGGRAAVIFFALDGILRRPAKIHDGSSRELGQLGHMTDDEGNAIGLPEDSPWRFDLRRYCDVIAYNDPSAVIPPVVVDAYADRADAVNTQDSLYHERVSSLLSADRLKNWIDDGYVDDFGRDVVVLDTGFDWDFDTRLDYESGHIPGAHYVDPLAFYEMVDLRMDGPILAPGMVPDGEKMDAFVQGYGIDENTVVVFTGNHVWGPVRAYWAFRYWGFAQDQLFVLDGRASGEQSVWTAAGYELETEEPAAPEPSDFSVGELEGNMDLVRATTQEFFMAAEGSVPGAAIIDARSEDEWEADVAAPVTNAFAFRVKGSVWYNWAEVLEDGEDGNHVFEPAAAISAELEALGVDRAASIYSFCQAGGRAAVIFFVCDGILGRPVKIHDGSSMELGQLAHLEDGSGADLCLPEDSPWRFDLGKYCEIIRYTSPISVIPPIVIDPYAESAGLVNYLDALYGKE